MAKKALKESKTIREVVLESGYVTDGSLTEDQLDEALDVLAMTRAPSTRASADADVMVARTRRCGLW